MKNRYFKGEKLVISGTLTDDGVITGSYNLKVRVIDPVKGLLNELDLTKTDNVYSIVFDTTAYTGHLLLRFVAYNASDHSEFIISNNDVALYIQ